jgi:integrase
MPLTDVQVRKAEGRNKGYRLSDDGGYRGLYLWVAPSGGKSWRWKYRFKGKEVLMTFGPYPEISLKEARDQHLDGRRKLLDGISPAEEKRNGIKKKAGPVVNPFKVVAEAWLEKWTAGKDEKHAANTERRLRDDILTRLGEREIDEIQPPDVVAVVKAIEARGASDVARRALQTTNQIFRYGIAHGLCRQNPAAMFRPGDVLKQVDVENFARVSEKELPPLLRKMKYYSGAPLTRLAMRLLSLTFLRTSELIGAEWPEIDMDGARWDIPKERMKGGKRPHVVPLSRQAVESLRELRNYRKNDRLVFPGDRDAEKPMSNNTILKALERMGYKGIMTGHGFRGVASTILHEKRYAHEYIELQLAHAPEDAVSAAYNHALYFEERAKIMQDWADYLDYMTAQGDGSD